jgi:hypothetical protein
LLSDMYTRPVRWMATTVHGPVAHWHVPHEVGLCLFDRGQLMASQEAALYRDTRKSMFRYVTTHTQSVPNCEARSSLQEASFKSIGVSLRTELLAGAAFLVVFFGGLLGAVGYLLSAVFLVVGMGGGRHARPRPHSDRNEAFHSLRVEFRKCGFNHKPSKTDVPPANIS